MKILTAIPTNVKLRKYSSDDVLFAYPDGSSIVEFQSTDSTKLIRILSTGTSRHRIDVQMLDTELEIEELAKKEFNISPVQPENVAPEMCDIGEQSIWHLRRLFLEGGRDMMMIETNFSQINNKKYRIDYIVAPEYYETGKWIFELITETLNKE